MKKTYYKTQTIQIKLSTTFLNRTKCKYCGEYSSFYYKIRNPSLNKDVSLDLLKFSYFKKNFKRMCDNYYLDYDPKSFRSNSSFNYPVSHKGYNPRLHRMVNAKLIFTEFVACKCGMTEWAFNYVSCENQPAFKRKTDRVNNKKFVF